MSTTPNCHGQIAIVDDLPANLRLLMNVLDSRGYDVRAFPKGSLALEGMKYAKPDLILLDIQMPEMNGYQVCERLKADPHTQDIPVLFISALGEAFDKVQAFEKGGVDYITKPFQAEEVLARVETHLKLARFTKKLSNTNIQQAEQLEEQNQQLQTAFSQLEASFEELKNAQTQLVQHEKMAALGNLVAGIAHEINNPLNFIQGNLQPAQEYVTDLLNLITLYQQTFPEPGEIIAQECDAIDLEFVQDDLPKLLASMQAGTERILQVSRSLRIFARSDRTQDVQFDLNEVLESALLILSHRLKANDAYPEIIVKINHEDELEPIQGSPGELGQVVINILANAIDAIEEKYDHLSSLEQANYQPLLMLSTQVSSGQIVMRLQDNANGMPSDIQSQIFESGFTTKPVGKGTGLGMAIAHQIITDKYRGKLTCNSILGEGTEFVIELSTQ